MTTREKVKAIAEEPVEEATVLVINSNDEHIYTMSEDVPTVHRFLDRLSEEFDRKVDRPGRYFYVVKLYLD